jgi:NADPH2:quinone reductase
MPQNRSGLELRSKISSDGTLELFLEEVLVPESAPDELVIRIEAAPLNPSDIILLLGPADPSAIRQAGTVEFPRAIATIPPERLAGQKSRLDVALPVGNEGAGVVIKTGSDAQSLIGRAVAARGGSQGMYAQYRVLKASDCLVLPEGASPREGASAFINPLTVLCMVETMRREGHKALVHTAAASNVGQMLNRICLADSIPLVNIVRNQAQTNLLRKMGARHVLDSTSPDFRRALVSALAETGATLAFDAIGGGTMAATILAAMVEVANAGSTTYSRYGSPVHKQVYIYGVLNSGPRSSKAISGRLGVSAGG